MGLFKKKNNTPALFILLDDEFNRAKNQEKHYFFHILYDNEKGLAQKWCKKNNVYMEVDHQTDGNIFYKFKF